MRFYTETHEFTCGIDLHAKNMHVCIQDRSGKRLVHRRLGNDEREFLRVIAPYRSNIVVSVESTFNWYWLGDLCQREGIPFVLGHAQYMKAIHQGKTKNDRRDSEKITKLTAAQMLPYGYAYPAEMRKVRDLMRRRLYFVRERAALKGHVKIVGLQYNVALERGTRAAKVAEQFEDRHVQESIACDVATAQFLDSVIERLERYVARQALGHDQEAFKLLQTIDGIGPILALTILYEMHTVKRFPRCQDFLSYARLVKSERTSNGESVGKGCRKIGNPYLKWAFSEAAVHMVSAVPEVKAYVEQLKTRYGAAGAWSRLSIKIGRTVYYMLKNNEHFCRRRFLQQHSKNALESCHNSLEPSLEAAMVID